MAEFTWTKKLSVGNALLDSDHKKLIDLVNHIELAIRAKDRDALPEMFNQLIDCVSVHFENEKRIARTIDFPFAEHELEYQYVQQELLHMRDELLNKDGRWSESAAEHYSYFLSAWFSDHLTEEAMLMKPVLKALPYDFDPASDTE